jgi:hypothetical protein
MPKYVLRFKIGKKEHTSQPVEAKTPRQAMRVFRGRYYATLKGWSDFNVLDKIGVAKDLTRFCR